VRREPGPAKPGAATRKVQLSFLTPTSALVAALVLVPAVALLRTNRVGRRMRRVLGLSEPRLRLLVVPIVALLAIAALLGSAAAQPVLSSDVEQKVRTDAEVFVVLDTSRSMLASAGPGSPIRLARAKAAALELRDSVPTVPFGIASVTDRTLPHLFPSADEDAFRATLQKAVGIERPPPVHSLVQRVTSLESLGDVATQDFFAPSAKRRVLVVLTDGETIAGTRARLGPLFRRPPGIATLFVHVWGKDERVYVRRTPEVGYRPDPSARDHARPHRRRNRRPGRGRERPRNRVTAPLGHGGPGSDRGGGRAAAGRPTRASARRARRVPARRAPLAPRSLDTGDRARGLVASKSQLASGVRPLFRGQPS